MASGGTLTITAPVDQFVGTTLTGGFWMANDATLAVTGGNIVTNQGELRLLGPASAFGNVNTIADNQGSFTIKNGRDFTTAGDLANSGSIGIGLDCTLTVSGDYTQSPEGVILVEMGSNGRLVAAGPASLAGTLVLSTTELDPSVGDACEIVTCASRTGTFDTILCQQVDGLFLAPVYADTNVTLHCTYGGDADVNLRVDYIDLGILATHYAETHARWAKGDFSGNGVVDYVDLGILATYYGYGTKRAAAVPAPATLALLALGGLALIRRRR